MKNSMKANRVGRATIFRTYTDANSSIINLRTEVFVKEQGESLSDEFGDEENKFHCCLYQDGVLLAYARYSFKDVSLGYIDRVAVIREKRKNGYGRQIVLFAEKKIDALGCRRFEINSQVQAKGFYEKLGYKTEGEMFLEIGIPHVKMTKQL